MRELAPTAFHRRLREALVEQEPGLFRWYSSDEYERERADRLRLEILRSSYRLSAESHERPHRLAREASTRLGIAEVPIVLYQLHQSETANAGLCFLEGEAHIVISGPLLASLDDDELLALFGHELAHHRLLTMDGGAYRTAADVLEASAAHMGAPPPFIATALRNRRWTEIFADRGAVIASGAIEPAIACLVKIGTGLGEVSVKDYLAQAREIVDKLGKTRDRGSDTHPENAVRAIALDLWQTKGDDAEAEIARLVEGVVALETLDLVQQRDIATATRAVVDRVLAPTWMRTDATLAHARVFFPGYAWSEPSDVALDAWDLEDYFAYVLLDFAVIDPALEEVALAQVLAVASELVVREQVVALARKELKMTAGAVTQLEQRAPSLFERAAQQQTVESES
jgi:Zn-dependent protease with chaperone function